MCYGLWCAYFVRWQSFPSSFVLWSYVEETIDFFKERDKERESKWETKRQILRDLPTLSSTATAFLNDDSFPQCWLRLWRHNREYRAVFSEREKEREMMKEYEGEDGNINEEESKKKMFKYLEFFLKVPFWRTIRKSHI